MVKMPFKNIFNNSILRMVLALTVVGVVSGASLVMVYNYAMPRINVNVNAETDRAIKNIFPDAANIRRSGDKGLYEALDKNGKLEGYAFLAEGNGYQGTIKLIVGVDPTVTVMKGMEVLESQETPGLGAEIAEAPFKGQFNGLSITHMIEYVKNQKPQQPYQIEAITGATISSRAVVTILNKQIEAVREDLKGGK